MRALKVLVVVMGVLIIGGTAALIAVIAHRMAAPAGGAGASATAVPAGPPVAPPGTQAAPYSRLLDEPDGTRITAVTAAGDRIAIALQGGGAADRLVLIDPHDGRVTGRLRLGR